MVSDGRLSRILRRFVALSADAELSLGDALCATSVDVLELAGAGITLHGTYTFAASNPVMADLQELEQVLGEGPCADAYRSGLAAAEPDLLTPATGQWPTFRTEAVRAGARAAFGYPLQVGSTRIGALNLYAVTAGPLSDDQHLDATCLADLATHAVLSAVDEIDDQHLAVHQATGMVSVQLSVPIVDALARLRAHAFAEGRTIASIAEDVVARRLRFDP